MLLAFEWGPPSGVVAVHWVVSLTHERPVAEVTTLLVDSDARRRGIGRLLIKAASQAARVAGCGGLTLSVADANAQASADLRAFCAATGFEAEGRRFSRALRKKA